MRPFEYVRSRTLSEAIHALAEYRTDACVLAGGTDLLIEWRRPYGNSPKLVVDISAIKELQGIDTKGGGVSLGALETHEAILRSPVVLKSAPLLSVAAGSIGSQQIRNRGTVGGNIMNAAACADTVPPLIALGAKVRLHSADGERVFDMDNFFVKPYKTKALPHEVLTTIHFPMLPGGAKSCFIKLGRRNALSISRLSVAVVLVRDSSGVITDARIVPGAALPTWRRVSEAEQGLLGEKPSHELFAAAGVKVSEVMIGEAGRRWSTEYKEPVIAVLVKRALEQCC